MKIKSFLILVLLFNLFFVSEVYCANAVHKKGSTVKKSAVKSKKTVQKKNTATNANLINSLYNCSTYTRVTDSRIVQIIGWANRKCNYREITSQRTIDCGFTSVQYQQLKNELRNTKNKSAINSISALNSYAALYPSACRSDDSALDELMGVVKKDKDDAQQTTDETQNTSNEN